MPKKITLIVVCAAMLFSAVPARADGPITLGLGTLTSIALSPDGTRLAVGTTIGVYFYDAQTFAPTGFWNVGQLIGQYYTAGPMVWSPRGDVIAMTTNDRTRFYSFPSGTDIWEHELCWHCVWTFSLDGAWAVLIKDELTAEVYDAISGVSIETVHISDFWQMSEWRVAHLTPGNTQSVDGKLVFVGAAWSGNCFLCAFVYSVADHSLIGTAAMEYLAIPGTTSPERAAISPNGQLVATSELDGRVNIWLIGQSKKPLYTLPSHHLGYDYGNSFAWSPDSHTVFSAARNTVVAWDVTTGTRLRTLDGYSAPVAQVAWSVDDQQLFTAEGEQLVAADVSSRKPLQVVNLASTWAWGVTEILPDPTGHLLAVADWGGVTLYDANTLASIHRLDIGRNITAMAFSPGGEFLATAGAGAFINLWDTASGRGRVDLLGDPDTQFIAALAFSTDGQTLCALESSGLLRRWDLASRTSTTVQTPRPVRNYYFDPSIHYNSGRVATERGQGGLDVSDLVTGQLLYNIPVNRPRSITINASGTRLAAVVGYSVMVWDLASGSQLAEFTGHTSTVTDIAFSPDGRSLASSSWDGTVRIWPVP